MHQENPEQGMMFGDYVDFEEMKKSAEEKKFVRYHFKQIVPGEYYSAKVKPMMVLWETLRTESNNISRHKMASKYLFHNQVFIVNLFASQTV